MILLSKCILKVEKLAKVVFNITKLTEISYNLLQYYETVTAVL